MTIALQPYADAIAPRGKYLNVDEPILRSAPLGPGWVYTTIALRVYRQRLGFASYDLALSAENKVLVVRSGWRFVGLRRRLPMVTIIDEGSNPRPASSRGFEPGHRAACATPAVGLAVFAEPGDQPNNHGSCQR